MVSKHPIKKLIGPFTQLLPMSELPLKGRLYDEQLTVIEQGGILLQNGRIEKVGTFNSLLSEANEVEEISGECVLLPSFVDAHTHICFGGSRARDYAARVSGKSYQEILQEGGGIYDTVKMTRASSEDSLLVSMLGRLDDMLRWGITTCEVKSGYGLSVEHELKMLRVIKQAADRHTVELVPTCLAAHVPGREFSTAEDYLQQVAIPLFEHLSAEGLSTRIDAFVEPEAFPVKIADAYLAKARSFGFDITVHADQFHVGGSELAVKYLAASADHLEASTDAEIQLLAGSSVVATVLPGASLGLGIPFAPARKLLDAGCILAIASDWNPGSAPMGDLLTQAFLLGAYEKLSSAEVFAGITFRAAKALRLTDRGMLKAGNLSDFVTFPTADFREIAYHQGRMKPNAVWKNGQMIKFG